MDNPTPTPRPRWLAQVILLVSMPLASLALAACAAEAPAAPVLVDPTGFATYVHPSGVFSLALPPDWVISDTSDSYALNVGFSPPGSPEPLISVYVVSAAAWGYIPPAPDESSAATDIDRLVSAYESALYPPGEATFKEMGRELQPDGSLRIRFLLEAPHRTSQHNDFVQVVGPYFVALRTTLPDDPAVFRTLSRIVSTLSVDALAAWASAIPEGQAEAGALQVVGFSNLNAWEDRTGGFVVVGQVTNNADRPLEFVRISAHLYDVDGNPLLQQDNFVSSDQVAPRERVPFSIVFSDGLPPGTARYELDASARYADVTAQTFYGPQNFALTSETAFDESGVLVVSGQLRNEGTLTANLVKVIVTIFDAEQRVIATDTTLVDVPKLAPGEVSPFSARFFELGGSPHTFQVTAQGLVEE